MPSRAALAFFQALERSAKLRQTPYLLRIRIQDVEKQTYFHASLAASVAAWDAYLNNIVREYYSIISKPLKTDYHYLHSIGMGLAERSLEKFNTPNFENSRNLLVTCTGYDPYPDWVWRQRHWTILRVQERLNQILKVRHSFAHGFSMPSYEWTRASSGKVRLTEASTKDVELLVKHLVKKTDYGLKKYISSSYAVSIPW